MDILQESNKLAEVRVKNAEDLNFDQLRKQRMRFSA